MLTLQQISEIREHLEKAQNPLFFFDNDNDGLMSFLLLQRFLGRGKGVAVKGPQHLNTGYFRKINELKPDYIFILDVPRVDNEFFKKVYEINLPCVWIDHHDIDMPNKKYVDYYNPYYNDKKIEPVSYLCYKIVNRKEDMWLAVIGCISDYYIPDFYEEFVKKYSDLAFKNPKTPFDVFYNSEIGRIARILDFSLKDKTTNVVNMMRFMMKVKEPIEVLEENSQTKQILKRYNEVNTKYQKILEKAKKSFGDKMIYFQYGGGLSFSSNLANELVYEFPKKIIVIIYVNDNAVNVSVRGKFADVRTMVLKSIEKIDGAIGGGHEHAAGARMNPSDLPEFRKRFEELVERV